MKRPTLAKNVALAESPGGKPVLRAYQDTKGIWTIGHGRNLQVMRITAEQADAWLVEDLESAEILARTFPAWQALDTGARQDAFIELVFNMGPAKVAKFKDTLAAIERKDWKAAAAHLLDSQWRLDVGPTRSARIAKQLETGLDP